MNKKSLNSSKNLEAMRHSCEHVLTQAMLRLFPGIKMAMGPAIEEGFYFDFDPGTHKISETDFPKIEAEMKKIIEANLPIKKQVISLDSARKLFKDNPYKQEWLDEIEKKGEKPTVYWTGDEFVDLCAGPHVKSTGEIGPFKLLSIAGAYWRGDEKNKMLTRIYGTCFPTQKELDHYLWQLEEAKKRDHRKLGKELDLFIIPEEVGPGLLIWTPKGAIIRREIENLLIEEQTKRGYYHVYSPHIGRKSLWITSGHWALYKDKMYSPMKIDKEDYLVKPMNCPMHMMIYKSKIRSYKELPLRIAEIASVYRYEKAGELTGMTRVRYITQDDAHIFCRKDQVVEEFCRVIDFIMFLLKTFQIKEYSLRLSIRDPKNKDKYLGNDEIWQEAEEKIKQAIKKMGLKPVIGKGEAAFYGPKLDVLVKDSLGREWQCGTCQVDFMLPERFDLNYIDQKGKKVRPVLIHRAPLGSLERWVGLLIEHYGGAFPVWLAPIQVIILPVTEKHLKYAKEIVLQLQKNNISRVEVDDRNETVSAKIRDAELQKIPYILVVGDKEVKNQTVNVRTRGEKILGMMSLENFLRLIKEDIAKKR
ncbi:MAG: threonine--tRNA ligase [Microgenomates group bacterium]